MPPRQANPIARPALERARGDLVAWLALAAICALAFGLRVYRLDSQSLWYDEAYSLRLAEMPFSQMIATTASDIHPPLYYLLIKAWLPFAGISEFSLRFPSLLLGVAMVPAAYALARWLLGRRTALFAALLAAASPFYVHYGQETRMYTLMGLLSLVAALCFLRGVTRPHPLTYRPSPSPLNGEGDRGSEVAWLVYVLAMTAALYSHLYAALTFGSLNLAFVAWVVLGRRSGAEPRIDRALLRRWLIAQAAVIVLYLPWIGVAVTKYLTYTSPAGGSTLDFILALTLVVFTTGHAVLPITVFPGQPGYDSDITLGLTLSAPFLALAVLGASVGLRRQSGETAPGRIPPRLATALALAMLLLPLLAIVVLSVGRRDYNARYLFAASPWYFLLIAAGLAWLSRRWRGALAAIAVLGLGAAWTFVLGNYYFVEKYARDDHRGAVAYLQRQVLPGDLVVLDANFDQVFTYYAPPDWAWIRFPDSVPPVPERTLATLASTAPQHRRVWLLEWGDYFLDPDRIVQGWLDTNAVKFDSKVFQGLVVSYGYLMTSPATTSPPAPSVPARAVFGGSIALDGYDILVDERDPSRRAHVTLHMRALRAESASLSVFLSLVDPAGNEVGHADSLPVNGALPVHVWTPGATVLNEMDLWVDPGVPPGDYRLRVGVLDQATMSRLAVGGGDTADLGNVRFERRITSIRGLDLPADGQAIFDGSIRLLGSSATRDSTGVTITHLWRTERSVSQRYAVFNHVVAPDGRIVGQKDGQPRGGSYPTDGWAPGEIVRDVYRVSLPEGTESDLRVLVGLYDPDGGARLRYSAGRWPFGRRGDALEVARLSAGQLR